MFRTGFFRRPPVLGLNRRLDMVVFVDGKQSLSLQRLFSINKIIPKASQKDEIGRLQVSGLALSCHKKVAIKSGDFRPDTLETDTIFI